MTSACVGMFAAATEAEQANKDADPDVQRLQDAHLYNKLAGQMNVTDIEERVKKSMRDEFEKIDIQAKIEAELNSKYSKLMEEEKKIQ